MPKNRYLLLPTISVFIILLLFIVKKEKVNEIKSVEQKTEIVDSQESSESAKVSNPAPTPTPVVEIVLDEASDIPRSKSGFWWLNSGARVFFKEDKIKTIYGELPENDEWRIRYNNSNPTETDNGYHPQNIFRLVTKDKYSQPIQSVYFKINRYILSPDEHRAASNGVLFFHHYQDGNNLYYAGLRVDGAVVIKKKIDGSYFTMAYEPIFSGEYDRSSNPNLLPINTWMGLKTELQTLGSGEVLIKVFIDKNNSGNWQFTLSATDSGQFGGRIITEAGYAGIRTDFMDVEFDKYRVTAPK